MKEILKWIGFLALGFVISVMFIYGVAYLIYS